VPRTGVIDAISPACACDPDLDRIVLSQPAWPRGIVAEAGSNGPSRRGYGERLRQ
jgi:hypothetical protein